LHPLALKEFASKVLSSISNHKNVFSSLIIPTKYASKKYQESLLNNLTNKFLDYFSDSSRENKYILDSAKKEVLLLLNRIALAVEKVANGDHKIISLAGYIPTSTREYVRKRRTKENA